MITLKQILNDALSSDTDDNLHQIVRAAYWAGEEKGRGETARKYNTGIAEFARQVEALRYHKKPLLLAAEILPSISNNDDSEEFLSWEFEEISE